MGMYDAVDPETEIALLRERQEWIRQSVESMNEAREDALAAARRASHEQSDLPNVRKGPIEALGERADWVMNTAGLAWPDLSKVVVPADKHANGKEMPDQELREIYRMSARKADYARKAADKEMKRIEGQIAQFSATRT
jgi:hypothetical protein